jgi:hypothetical protein
LHPKKNQAEGDKKKKHYAKRIKREEKNDNDDETPYPSEKKRELKLHKYTEIKEQEKRKRSVYTEKITACQPSHPKLSNPSDPNPIQSDPIRSNPIQSRFQSNPATIQKQQPKAAAAAHATQGRQHNPTTHARNNPYVVIKT